MGASCCIAARNKPLSNQTAHDAASVNYGCSPSWSLHDSRTHTNDICDNQLFQRNSDNPALEIINYVHTETDGHSDGGNPSCPVQSPNLKKSRINGRVVGDDDVIREGQEIKSNILIMGKDLDTSSCESISLNPGPLIPTDSSQSSSAFNLKTLLPQSSFPSGPASLSKARRSFGYRLFRQISDSRIIKSLRDHDSAERRKSLMPSACNNDMSAGGSCGGSSDHWSAHLFSELVASSQRVSLSFDCETSNCGHPSSSLTPAKLHKCGICLKDLKERLVWSSQNLGASDVPVVAVLFCGHVYHAECLENLTLETDIYDPPCPVCTTGGKQGSTSLRKAGTKARSRNSKAAVGDFDLDSSTNFELQKCMEYDEKVAKTSFSLKSSFTRRFWRGHLSTGSRTLEYESTRKKGARV